MSAYRFLLTSSLEKVFADAEPAEMTHDLEALRNERVSFQIAYYAGCPGAEPPEDTLRFEVNASCPCDIKIRKVCLMPASLVCGIEHDSDYLRTSAGMFPDLLEEMPDSGVRTLHRQWRSVWVDVTPGDRAPAGDHEIRAAVYGRAETPVWSASLTLRVTDAALPGMNFIHTEWFHADCIADYYRVKVFSEEHWKLLENFIRYAVRHGINMLLTPLFTPPMDTAVGGERTTVQLIDVTRKQGAYTFGFSKLDRWIGLALDCGVEYLEMAPLFTQWGAYHAPKIIAEADGARRQIFGWQTDASEPEYQRFLHAFLPELRVHLQELGVWEKTWFHVSDEPSGEQMESYRPAQKCMTECLPGAPLLDACSDLELYLGGAVQRPVVSNDHIMPFIEKGVPDLWTYYCCAQGVDVGNRFFAMPSYRNRILGVQAYLFRLQGFLHWGYNFYNAQFSRRHLDPYAVTDCDEGFPAGDAFLVYPGADGEPRGSIRLAVLEQAMNDLRAFRCLEGLAGRARVVDIIQEEAGEPVTFTRYPRNQDFFFRLRRRINAEIQKAANGAH